MVCETILIYICCNCAAGFVVCVLLRQAAGKREMPFSGKGFAILWLNEFSGGAQCWGWMEEQEGSSAESGAVILVGATMGAVEPLKGM